MVRAILYSHLVGGTHLWWPVRTAIFYIGTAVVAVTFVSIIVRTPLRWVIGGPVRAEQRVRDNAEVAVRRGEGIPVRVKSSEASASRVRSSKTTL
jgi:hypothetical protein